MPAFPSLPSFTLAALVLVAGVPAVATSAEDKNSLRTDLPPALAERLLTERQAREACKKEICEVARSKRAEGAPIACKVLKTWPAQDLKNKILKGKMEWNFGHAQCEVEEKLDRSLLVRAMTEPKVEIKFGKHHVECNLEQEDGKGAHRIAFTLDPSVTFVNGKAVKGVLGWSEVAGDAFAKSALRSITIVDNTFNVLQST